MEWRRRDGASKGFPALGGEVAMVDEGTSDPYLDADPVLLGAPYDLLPERGGDRQMQNGHALTVGARRSKSLAIPGGVRIS